MRTGKIFIATSVSTVAFLQMKYWTKFPSRTCWHLDDNSISSMLEIVNNQDCKVHCEVRWLFYLRGEDGGGNDGDVYIDGLVFDVDWVQDGGVVVSTKPKWMTWIGDEN